jgi:hypothetical protein
MVKPLNPLSFVLLQSPQISDISCHVPNIRNRFEMIKQITKMGDFHYPTYQLFSDLEIAVRYKLCTITRTQNSNSR